MSEATTKVTWLHRWRPEVLALLAALVVVLGTLLGAAPASAATAVAAQNGVGASNLAGHVVVGSSAGVVAGQRLGNDPSRAQFVVVTGAAAETAGEEGAAGETVFSGHGAFVEGSGKVTLPEGTSISTYAPHNSYITDAVGNQIELGNPPVPTQVFGPGETMPNYNLYPPGDLNIAGNPVTVGRATPLSELLKPNMGMCHWAACTEVIPGS